MAMAYHPSKVEQLRMINHYKLIEISTESKEKSKALHYLNKESKQRSGRFFWAIALNKGITEV